MKESAISDYVYPDTNAPSGWICSQCGQFVWHGISHVCHQTAWKLVYPQLEVVEKKNEDWKYCPYCGKELNKPNE